MYNETQLRDLIQDEISFHNLRNTEPYLDITHFVSYLNLKARTNKFSFIKNDKGGAKFSYDPTTRILSLSFTYHKCYEFMLENTETGIVVSVYAVKDSVTLVEHSTGYRKYIVRRNNAQIIVRDSDDGTFICEATIPGNGITTTKECITYFDVVNFFRYVIGQK